MIIKLLKRLGAGTNYLVELDKPDVLDDFLIQNLFNPAIAHHNFLWGKKGKWLSLTGRKLGWVPNQLPFTFFSETVLEEISNSFVSSQNKLEGKDIELKNAHILLEQLQIRHLREQNPFLLSAGESRLVWFLMQWAKQPVFLVSSYLPMNLSPERLLLLLNFIIHSEERAYHIGIKPPNFVLGFLVSQMDWTEFLISKQTNWKKITMTDLININWI